jgi:hypothetical protein
MMKETVNVCGILVIKHVKYSYPSGRKKKIFKIGVRERGCEVLWWMG